MKQDRNKNVHPNFSLDPPVIGRTIFLPRNSDYTIADELVKKNNIPPYIDRETRRDNAKRRAEQSIAQEDLAKQVAHNERRQRLQESAEKDARNKKLLRFVGGVAVGLVLFAGAGAVLTNAVERDNELFEAEAERLATENESQRYEQLVQEAFENTDKSEKAIQEYLKERGF